MTFFPCFLLTFLRIFTFTKRLHLQIARLILYAAANKTSQIRYVIRFDEKHIESKIVISLFKIYSNDIQTAFK
jgi:hypothetical protein